MYVADLASLVDQVDRWPIAIAIGPPGERLIVDGDCVRHVQPHQRLFHVVDFPLTAEFRHVVADDYQAVILVLVVPFPQRGNRMDAINSAKRPHVEQDDLAAQAGQPQRL